MGKLLLLILVSTFFAVQECKTEVNEDDETCSKGMSSYLDSYTGYMQGAVDSMFSSDKTVAPKFLHFSRQSDQEPCNVTNANFPEWDADGCDFNSTLKTIFIIHGFKDGYAPWTRELKDALILREDCNVFIVEWGEPSDTYSVAVKSVPQIGKQVALFIQNLMKSRDLELRHVHIIGHSCGAHAAGFAGKEIKKAEKRSVDRITGLDPAGPAFYDAEVDQRLDATDADFVDIIHTNGGCNRLEGLGYSDAIGHFDFYPNGGKTQPGCLTVSQFLGRMDYSLAKNTFKYMFGTLLQPEMQYMSYLLCSHTRAFEIFTASVRNENCKFRSVQCSGWKRYLSGQCDGNEKVAMGYYADRYRDFAGDTAKKFYHQTAADPPYCVLN